MNSSRCWSPPGDSARLFRALSSMMARPSTSSTFLLRKPVLLRARIVTESSGGLWHISEVYACASTFVTDFDRFEELRTKETGR